MALYYFDASALVKYYVTEPGSTWVRQLIEEQGGETGQFRHVVLVAEITRVEVAAAQAEGLPIDNPFDHLVPEER